MKIVIKKKRNGMGFSKSRTSCNRDVVTALSRTLGAFVQMIIDGNPDVEPTIDSLLKIVEMEIVPGILNGAGYFPPEEETADADR